MTFEERVRVYEEAKRSFEANVRKWMAEQDVKPVTEGDSKALERLYTLEHQEEIAALSALASEVNVAKAELERRWIEAHEDLAVLRKVGLPQRSS